MQMATNPVYLQLKCYYKVILSRCLCMGFFTATMFMIGGGPLTCCEHKDHNRYRNSTVLFHVLYLGAWCNIVIECRKCTSVLHPLDEWIYFTVEVRNLQRDHVLLVRAVWFSHCLTVTEWKHIVIKACSGWFYCDIWCEECVVLQLFWISN